jgi:iron transport multicopper oxidase
MGNRVGDYFQSAFNSTLINGKGRYPDGPATSLAVVNVKQGKRSVLYFIQRLGTVYLDFSRRISYRFRLVSISCDPSFIFSIDNHTMTVIEVEGTNTQPLLIDSLEIFAGACGFIQVSCSANRC